MAAESTSSGPVLPTLLAVHPVLASSDVARSIKFYESLGFVASWRDSTDPPRYAAVTRDGVELHLQWCDASELARPGDRPVFRFLVRDVDGLHRQFQSCPEIKEMTRVFDSSWGTREFHVRDPDRNGLQFYYPR